MNVDIHIKTSGRRETERTSHLDSKIQLLRPNPNRRRSTDAFVLLELLNSHRTTIYPSLFCVVPVHFSPYGRMDQQDLPLPIPPSTPLPSVLAWVGSPNYELKEKILAAARRDPQTTYTPSQEPTPTSPPTLPSGPQVRRPLRPIGSNSSKRPRHNDSLSSILTDSGSSLSSTTTLNSATGPPTAASSLAPGRQGTRSPPPVLPERVLSRSNSAHSTLPDPTNSLLTVDQQRQQQQQKQSEPWSLQKLLSEVDSRRTKQREQSARENANRTFNRVRSVDRSFSLSAGKTRSVERARTLGPETFGFGSVRLDRERGEGGGNKLPLSSHNRQNGVKQTNSIPSMSPRLDTLSSKSKSAPSFPYPYLQHPLQPQQAQTNLRDVHRRDIRAISPLRPLSQITVSPKPMTTLGTTAGGSPLKSCLSPNRQGQKRKSSEPASPSKRPSFAAMTELVAGPSRPPSAPVPLPQARDQSQRREKRPLFLPSSPPSSQPFPSKTHTTTATATTTRTTRQDTRSPLPIPTINQPPKDTSNPSPLPPPPIMTTTTTTMRSNEPSSKAHLYPPPKVPIGSRRTTRHSHGQHPHLEGHESERTEITKPTVRTKEREGDEEDGETSFDSFDGMFDALGDEGRKELEAVLRVVDGRS